MLRLRPGSSPEHPVDIDAIRPPADREHIPLLDPSVKRRVRYIEALRREAVIGRGLAVADVLANYVSLGIVAMIGGVGLRWPALLAAPLFIVVAKGMGLYDRDENVLHKTTLDEVPRLFGLATATTLVLWLADGLAVAAPLDNVQVLALWGGLLALLLVSFRATSRAAAAAAQPPERCLVIGSEEDAEFLRAQLELAATTPATVVGAVSAGTNGADGEVRLPPRLGEILIAGDVDRVIVSSPSHALDGAGGLLTALRQLKGYRVKVSLLPKGPRLAGPGIELDHLPGVTLIGVRSLSISRSSRFVKRSFDLIGAGLGLLILSPILTAIAIAIKLETAGPIFFRQRRIGRHGRAFSMLKFRSMVNEADQLKQELVSLNEGGPGLFKLSNDPRVTRVGRLLRRLSLDEFPQLINVLAGKMSLVGPRPLIPEEDGQIVGHYRRRLDVRPGMTGHWQVLCGARRVALSDMAKLDCLYVGNWTLWNDVLLLMRTVPIVVCGRGI